MQYVQLKKLQQKIQKKHTVEDVEEWAKESMSRFIRLHELLAEDYVNPQILAVAPTEWEWFREQLIEYPDSLLWEVLLSNKQNSECLHKLEYALLKIPIRGEAETYV